MLRGKRRVTLGGRFISSIDEGYRRLDPLPDRSPGRKIVVSPIVDDDKGKSTDEKYLFWPSFSPGSCLICNGPVMLVYCKFYPLFIS